MATPALVSWLAGVIGAVFAGMAVAWLRRIDGKLASMDGKLDALGKFQASTEQRCAYETLRYEELKRRVERLEGRVSAPPTTLASAQR